MPKTCFEGPLGDVLGTFRINYQLRPLKARLRPREVRSGRPWDGQIGSLWDVVWTMEGDVLITSWGPIFAGWERTLEHANLTEKDQLLLVQFDVFDYCYINTFIDKKNFFIKNKLNLFIAILSQKRKISSQQMLIYAQI